MRWLPKSLRPLALEIRGMKLVLCKPHRWHRGWQLLSVLVVLGVLLVKGLERYWLEVLRQESLEQRQHSRRLVRLVAFQQRSG
jgi:hypothetical protein